MVWRKEEEWWRSDVEKGRGNGGKEEWCGGREEEWCGGGEGGVVEEGSSSMEEGGGSGMEKKEGRENLFALECCGNV